MMKYVLIITFIILIAHNGLFAEVNTYDESFIPFRSLWNFYSDNRISATASGKGYTGIACMNSIDGVIINPASMNLVNKYQFYFEYIFKTNMKWYIDDIYLKQIHPSFFLGVGIKKEDSFQIGLIYCTKNSYRLEVRIERRDNSISYDPFNPFEPEPTIIHDDIIIHSLIIPVVYSYENIRLGVNFNYFYYSYISSLFPTKINFSKFVPKFGILILPTCALSIGLTYMPETKEAVTLNWGLDTENKYGPNIFPLEIGFGINYKLSFAPLEVSLDYNYSNDSKEKNYVDRKDIHFGTEIFARDNLTLRTGFFTQKDYRSDKAEYIDNVGDRDQVYVTFGITYLLKGITLNLAIMDSHLISKGNFKHTYINTGISYSL